MKNMQDSSSFKDKLKAYGYSVSINDNNVLIHDPLDNDGYKLSGTVEEYDILLKEAVSFLEL